MARFMILAIIVAAVASYLAIWLIRGDTSKFPWEFDHGRFGKRIGYFLLALLALAVLVLIPVLLVDM